MEKRILLENDKPKEMSMTKLILISLLGALGIVMLLFAPKSNLIQQNPPSDVRIVQRYALLTVMSNLTAANLVGVERVSKSELNIREEDIIHIVLKDGAYVAVAYWDKDGQLKSMFK